MTWMWRIRCQSMVKQISTCYSLPKSVRVKKMKNTDYLPVLTSSVYLSVQHENRMVLVTTE